MSLRIRLATPSDAAAISGIHVRTARSAYRGLLLDSYLAGLSEAALEQRWRNGIENSEPQRCLWVADDDRVVAGFCETGLSEDDDATPETAHDGWLYVERERIGTGVGRALFEHALNDLGDRGFLTVTLWVFRDNDRARRFYDVAGWQPHAERTKSSGDADVAEIRYRIELSARKAESNRRHKRAPMRN